MNRHSKVSLLLYILAGTFLFSFTLDASVLAIDYSLDQATCEGTFLGGTWDGGTSTCTIPFGTTVVIHPLFSRRPSLVKSPPSTLWRLPSLMSTPAIKLWMPAYELVFVMLPALLRVPALSSLPGNPMVILPSTKLLIRAVLTFVIVQLLMRRPVLLSVTPAGIVNRSNV